MTEALKIAFSKIRENVKERRFSAPIPPVDKIQPGSKINIDLLLVVQANNSYVADWRSRHVSSEGMGCILRATVINVDTQGMSYKRATKSRGNPSSALSAFGLPNTHSTAGNPRSQRSIQCPSAFYRTTHQRAVPSATASTINTCSPPRDCTHAGISCNKCCITRTQAKRRGRWVCSRTRSG